MREASPGESRASREPAASQRRLDESHNEAKRREAMRRFYVAQHPRLLQFVTRRVGDEKEAEDVCQETWRVFFFGYDNSLLHTMTQ